MSGLVKRPGWREAMPSVVGQTESEAPFRPSRRNIFAAIWLFSSGAQRKPLTWRRGCRFRQRAGTYPEPWL